MSVLLPLLHLNCDICYKNAMAVTELPPPVMSFVYKCVFVALQSCGLWSCPLPFLFDICVCTNVVFVAELSQLGVDC